MSYKKQTWKNGDIITAEKLNHIEDGIANLVFDFNSVFLDQNTIDGDKIEQLKTITPPIVYLNHDGPFLFLFDSAIDGGFYQWKNNNNKYIAWDGEPTMIKITICLGENFLRDYIYDETSNTYNYIKGSI